MALRVSRILLCVCLGLCLCFSVSAVSYNDDFPSYVGISGGAFLGCTTEQGLSTIVVPIDYQYGTFGFKGDESNVMNLTSDTVTGMIYYSSPSSFYGSPTELQCRFTGFGTLEVYEPYASSYGGVRYQWTAQTVQDLTATNCQLIDYHGGRQNDAEAYDQHTMILIVVVVVLALLAFIIWKRGRKQHHVF